VPSAAKSLPDHETLAVPGLPPVEGQAVYLGMLDYQTAWQLQLELVAARTADRIADTLLLCQHPDVVTVGRRQAAQQNILDARFPLFEVERGGDVTYHGPGQLVGYPIILKLRPAPHSDGIEAGARVFGERDLHRYLRALEGAIIDLCEECGVATDRKAGATGVWTQGGAHKLASLGIAVRRWVTFHGFALNVDTDLSRFSAINPCGFSAQVMTSLVACAKAAELHVEALLDRAIVHLGARLSRRFTRIAPAEFRAQLSLATAE
jgi:lipoyl(octanoyl) transferase